MPFKVDIKDDFSGKVSYTQNITNIAMRQIEFGQMRTKGFLNEWKEYYYTITTQIRNL